MSTMLSAEPAVCANHTYYYDVGVGDWTGHFGFRVTSWRTFFKASIGLKNRLLVLAMAVTSRVLGRSLIVSRLEPAGREGDADVVANDVRITKFGVTLYLLRERYHLNPDCRQVWVKSQERFGPIPFLFNTTKEHPAEIMDGGMRSVYYMPLLGTDWEGRYTVQPDRNHIDAVLVCPWAEASEVISRVH